MTQDKTALLSHGALLALNLLAKAELILTVVVYKLCAFQLKEIAQCGFSQRHHWAEHKSVPQSQRVGGIY